MCKCTRVCNVHAQCNVALTSLQVGRYTSLLAAITVIFGADFLEPLSEARDMELREPIDPFSDMLSPVTDECCDTLLA